MPALLERPTAEQRPYRPIGAAEGLLYDRSTELILEGPAGTGKSRACLEKLHILASRYPGARLLMVRKTRASLTQAAMVTFEQHVLPVGSPIAAGPTRDHRSAYIYPNGSEIVIGGLGTDRGEKTRVMSTEYDVIYVQEAREILESEWEELSSRLRNGRVPYQQMIGDTNPDAPSHWIKQREKRGQTRLLPSRHEDNPTVTPEYLARLDALTGIRHKRLRLGLWVAAEGIVYEGWDSAVHIGDAVRCAPEWPRYLAIDFGFTNPFVAQWWCADPDGRLTRYRELYQTQGLVEDHAHRIRQHSVGESIKAIVCDHDAEDRATLERHLRCKCVDFPPIWAMTTAARKDVSPGIQAVQKRLQKAGDGKPRLTFARDALIERDALLLDRKLPTCTEEEVESYVWDMAAPKVNPDGTQRKEEPLKLHDHGMDATRYMVMHLDWKSVLSEAAGQSHPLSVVASVSKPNANPEMPRLGGADLIWPAPKGRD